MGPSVCPSINEVDRIALIGAAAFLTFIKNDIGSNEESLGGENRFCVWAPTAGEERTRWAILGMYLRHEVRFVRLFNPTPWAAFEAKRNLQF